MKLVFQIACGIVVAVAVIAGCVFGFYKISAVTQEQRVQAANKTVIDLTPEIVIARCGKPVTDRSQNITPDINGAVINRVLAYNNPSGVDQIEITFTSLGHGGDFLLLQVAENTYGGVRLISDSQQRIATLPCLAPGASEAATAQ